MEKNDFNVLKVRSNVLLSELGLGAASICIGLANVWENAAGLALDGIALLLVLMCVLIPRFMRQEEPDEMSRRHYEMARAWGYKVLASGVLLLYVIDRIDSTRSILSLRVTMPVLFGLGCVAVGIYFSRMEKKGEPWQS